MENLSTLFNAIIAIINRKSFPISTSKIDHCCRKRTKIKRKRLKRNVNQVKKSD